MEIETDISTAFPYRSRYASVKGSKMHYIEEGNGDPVLFIHGIPTSCYLWRNIIPHLSPYAHCIAVDLIGMGKSDKPDIDYRVFDHIEYIEGFIQALGLKDLTLVVHGWGSVIGFDYARRNEKNIKAMAFIESHVRSVSNWDMVSLPLLELASAVRAGDDKDEIHEGKYYIDKFLPTGVLRKLTKEEIDHYRQPFVKPGSSKPIWQCLRDLPLGNGPKDVVDLIDRYSKWLTQTQIPKLMLYAVPGFMTTIDTVRWAHDKLPNLKLVDIGEDLLYAQESNPTKIGAELSTWYQSL